MSEHQRMPSGKCYVSCTVCADSERVAAIMAESGLTRVDSPGEAVTWQPGDPVATPAVPGKLAHGTRWVYTQPCERGGDDQRVSISIDSQAAGGYIVLRTARWVMDSEAEVAQLVRWMLDALARAKEVE